MSQVTKRALEASLKHLLLQKPLNKITINDIAEDCGINRMTFYYHFKDIYDLVEWSCQEDASRALAGKKTYETWQQGFLQILQAVLDNKPFILNVYRSVSREQVERERDAAVSDLTFVVNQYRLETTGIDLCGLCEYDLPPVGENGQTAECPGFYVNDCFKWRGPEEG